LQRDAERPRTSSWVLDSSAILAAIFGEPGAGRVQQAVSEGAALSSVNLSEVVARLLRSFDEQEVRDFLRPFEVTVFDLDDNGAWQTALLLPRTRSSGLSLGDRACLELAALLGLPAMTADRNWLNVDVGVEVVLCR
jgi:ribonuclease VapC